MPASAPLDNPIEASIFGDGESANKTRGEYYDKMRRKHKENQKVCRTRIPPMARGRTQGRIC